MNNNMKDIVSSALRKGTLVLPFDASYRDEIVKIVKNVDPSFYADTESFDYYLVPAKTQVLAITLKRSNRNTNTHHAAGESNFDLPSNRRDRREDKYAAAVGCTGVRYDDLYPCTLNYLQEMDNMIIGFNRMLYYTPRDPSSFREAQMEYRDLIKRWDLGNSENMRTFSNGNTVDSAIVDARQFLNLTNFALCVYFHSSFGLNITQSATTSTAVSMNILSNFGFAFKKYFVDFIKGNNPSNVVTELMKYTLGGANRTNYVTYVPVTIRNVEYELPFTAKHNGSYLTGYVNKCDFPLPRNPYAPAILDDGFEAELLALDTLNIKTNSAPVAERNGDSSSVE